MSNSLIALVAIIYLGVAISFFKENNPGMGLCFIGYVIGNIGIIIANIGHNI